MGIQGRTLWAIVVALCGGMAACAAHAPPAERPVAAAAPPAVADPGADLTGVTWRLVGFKGGDDRAFAPDDRSSYTLRFTPDGKVQARLDCNRGMGSWTSAGPGQLALGPLALTRAMCPPGSLHDRLAKDWGYVRSYVLEDGHLYLSLLADAGIYEYEPEPVP